MSDEDVYLRRVRDPNPILLELARQVVDDAGPPGPTRTLRFFRLALAARAAFHEAH